VKRVAVFGNAGGGKSTVARELARITGLPLHVIDMMQFRAGGAAVPEHEFLGAHAELLKRDTWIIDGFGGVEPAWERFAAADTLVYVDLPLSAHFAGVTKRFVKGLFSPPPGWPERSPLVKSTLSSYRVLWPCHRQLTPKYRALVSEAQKEKRVHHLRSKSQRDTFLLERRLGVAGQR
jgi:adenylate kinase family enzyme